MGCGLLIIFKAHICDNAALTVQIDYVYLFDTFIISQN